MPSVALILCTLFVLFLLYLDHKQYPKASVALWVPTVWFLIETSRAVGYWLGFAATDSVGNVEEGSTIDRYLLILLFIISVITLRIRRTTVTAYLKNNLSVFVFLGFMLISISWSEIPFVSLKRWFRNVIAIYMAVMIASEADPRQALLCILRRMVYIHMPFSLLLIHYYGHLGRLYGRWTGQITWIGVSTQKNGLAYICTVSLLYFVWLYIIRSRGRYKLVVWYQKYIEIVLIVMSIYLFMGPGQSLTYSATSLVSLIIGIATLSVLLLKKGIVINAKILTIIICAVIIYGTTLPFIGHLTIVDPTSMLGRDSTLTDRATVWANLIPYAKQHPILGHGYGGFWSNEMRDSLYFPAHNGYLDTILDIGFMGLIFLAMFMISSGRKALASMSRDPEWAALWLSFLLIALARNMAESVITSLSQSTPALLLFLMAVMGSRSDSNMKKEDIPVEQR